LRRRLLLAEGGRLLLAEGGRLLLAEGSGRQQVVGLGSRRPGLVTMSVYR
jgi:hypothetical protein